MFGLNSSKKRLRRMLEAIRSRDFTLQYSLEKLSGEERRLAEEINAVITEFRQVQAEQEAQYGCFETLLNQVNAALFVDDCLGHITWMNKKAVNELCGFRIRNLSELASLHPSLPDTLETLSTGQQKLVTLRIGDHEVEWKITMTRYFREGSESRLFSIENIQPVLLQNEVEAQKKLVSVLTHEIMNSLSPIISLSETLMEAYSPLNPPEGGLLADANCSEGKVPLQGDLEGYGAVLAIHRRSSGLLRFVENYRQLARIAPPQKQPVAIGSLIGEIQRLFSAPNIKYYIEDPTDEVNVDRSQMEQVVINLIKNAEEAISDMRPEEGRIEIRATSNRPTSQLKIAVKDNGMGILPEVIDRIFVPFFTTKPNGSGIGLTLCRQIVANHNGIIKVKSQPGATVFTITLSLYHG